MKRLIILDRDGVINHDSAHYIKSIDEFHVIPESLEAIGKLTKAGFIIGVATNQSGIARGLYSHETLDEIHQYLKKEVEAYGGQINAIEYCAHMPDSGCPNRKPAPGMLKRIAKTFDMDLTGVPYIGDRISDIMVAQKVGAKPYLIESPMTNQDELVKYDMVPRFKSLLSCVNHILVENR